MTDIDQANGHRPAARPDPFIPAQREPQDTVPPGVWRGPAPTDQDDSADPTDPAGAVGLGLGGRATGGGLVRRVVTHPRTRTAPVIVVKGAVRAVTHERTQAAGRTVIRQGAYVLVGAHQTARKRHQARTLHTRMIRAAEVAGDHASVAEWAERHAKHKQERHTRRMTLLTMPLHLAKALAIGGGISFAGLITLGIVLGVHERSLHEVISPLMTTISAISWCVHLLELVYGPVLMTLPFAILAALWNAGRQAGAAPAWLMAPDPAKGSDVVPDEGAILSALRNLNSPELNKAFKAGWQPRWVSGTGRLGNGWHTQLQLPQGVSVEKICERKKLLAHNLMRLPIEVWATEPRNQPTVLDLWVADQGSLSGPVPAYPLLTAGECDYFKGVPIGVSQRGDSVYAALMARNYMVGGIMGTGKSSVTRNILLGAMLDPLVDIDVYVMAFNSDYDAMRPRLRTLVKGDDDEQVKQALDALRELRADVTRRGQILDSSGGEELALTRETAEHDARMRPRVVVFDECHELFEHKQYGEEAAELAVKVLKKARKCGITLIFVTVSPTASSIPKDVTRNTSNRVAFALGDHVANDGILGAGRYKAGITATTLSPGEDIGTALTVGFTKNAFELVRMHFVEKSKRVDEITPIVQRALALREAADLDQVEPADAVPVLDPLADIAAVLAGAARMRTQEVLSGLAVRNPAAYRRWTLADLTAALKAADAAPYKTQGVMHVNGDLVRAALADRADEPENDDTNQ
ncbi:MAG TPA: zonular occludens toxin domain-containing protein [Actinocrinis sp.]|nr:zonular occludens toxin domain-containing protein [Actinocrinis sp.]